MSNNITVQDILDAVSDEYTDDVDTEFVESEIARFEEFDVYGKEQLNGILPKVANQLDITTDELTGGDDGNGNGGSNGPAPVVDIEDIDTDEEWVSLEAEVVELWDPFSDSMAQVGLLDDGTGRIKFVAWEKSDLILLNEGDQYALENVITDEYEGKMSVKLNSETDIEFLEEEKDISGAVEVEGNFVSLQSGSGLIKRCPEEDCTRTLGKNDRCSEHGEVDGDHDLRIKGVLDDGHKVYNVIVNDHDLIKGLTGIDLDEATEMARDALDTEVVGDEMEPELLGQYFHVEGQRIGDFIAVDEISKTTERADPESLIVKARAI